MASKRSTELKTFLANLGRALGSKVQIKVIRQLETPQVLCPYLKNERQDIAYVVVKGLDTMCAFPYLASYIYKLDGAPDRHYEEAQAIVIAGKKVFPVNFTEKSCRLSEVLTRLGNTKECSICLNDFDNSRAYTICTGCNNILCIACILNILLDEKPTFKTMSFKCTLCGCHRYGMHYIAYLVSQPLMMGIIECLKFKPASIKSMDFKFNLFACMLERMYQCGEINDKLMLDTAFRVGTIGRRYGVRMCSSHEILTVKKTPSAEARYKEVMHALSLFEKIY